MINLTTNDLNKLESYNIRKYHKYSEINEFLSRRQSVNDFIYINNDRIGKDNLWNDGIHLNKSGTIILANNFIDVLNKTNYYMI